MKKMCFFITLLPFLGFGQKQILSFGARADSTGAIFLIQQVVTLAGDTTHTTANAIRFLNASAAIPAVLDIRERVRADSTVLSAAALDNRRHATELDLILGALSQIVRAGGQATEQETAEQEIARLREENKRLRKGKN